MYVHCVNCYILIIDIVLTLEGPVGARACFSPETGRDPYTVWNSQIGAVHANDVNESSGWCGACVDRNGWRRHIVLDKP